MEDYAFNISQAANKHNMQRYIASTHCNPYMKSCVCGYGVDRNCGCSQVVQRKLKTVHESKTLAN